MIRPSRRTDIAVGAVLMGLVALTAACAVPVADGDGSPPGTGGSAGTVTVDAVGHVCLDRPEPHGQESARLGDSEPAAVVECRQDSERVPGQGEWSVRVERRAIGGVSAFAAALRLPDEPRTASACAAIGQVLPEVYVLDAEGRAKLVAWPVDACGLSQQQARAAYEALRWRTTGTRRVNQLAPQAAIDSGCATAWKNPFAPGIGPAAGSGTRTQLPSSGPVRTCTYRVTDAHDNIDSRFESGHRLDDGAWRETRRLLASAPPAPACTASTGRFTVVQDELYVELDGCRRVLTPDGSLRLAGPRLLAALAA